MAKLLNLKLFYKGKLINFATQGKEFKDKWIIGSDKYLFWQILDPSFPLKYELVSKKGEQFVFQLNSKMQFAYVTADKQEPVSGKEIILKTDRTGKLSIGTDWAVSYEFSEPRVLVLTQEEQQIVHQYARRAELEPFEKFTRNFLIAATCITVLCAIAYDIFKPKPVPVDNSLVQRWEQIQQMAQKVEVAKNDTENFEDAGEAEAEAPKEAPKPEAVTTTAGVKGGTGTGTMSKEAAKSALKGLFGTSGVSSGGSNQSMNLASTFEEDIVASSMGGGKGGGGGGKGPGKGGGKGGTSFGSVFDPTAVSGGTTNLAGLSTGRPKGLSSTNPGGTVATFVGDASRLAPVGKPVTKVSAAVLSKFSGPSVSKVKEGSLSSAPAEMRPELQRIEQRVARYKPQIKDLFNRQSQIKAMYGTVKFTIYIDTDGSVKDAAVTPMSGEFYPEFLTQARQIMLSWKFDNKNIFPYEFSMIFSK